MWDVFISHASEDKEEVARPLANALRQAGLQVWYDEFMIPLGKEIRPAVIRGQNESRYAVVILSPNFFQKEWAQRELNTFVNREIEEKREVILPVWHQITRPEVVRFAPDLAGRRAALTSEGLEQVVQQILNVCRGLEDQGTRQEVPKQKPLVVRLRSEPKTVSERDVQKVFNLDSNDRPREYIQNEYEDQGMVVFDHATGLIWQKSGSDYKLFYTQAHEYVEELNSQKFAGYNDWRLPTIPELMSLLEPSEKNGDLFIDPVFDATQRWCCSADLIAGSSAAAWGVDFSYGRVDWGDVSDDYYVRAVRSRQ
jgi:hypothetical protein